MVSGGVLARVAWPVPSPKTLERLSKTFVFPRERQKFHFCCLPFGVIAQKRVGLCLS